jgi:hypothetical protein
LVCVPGTTRPQEVAAVFFVNVHAFRAELDRTNQPYLDVHMIGCLHVLLREGDHPDDDQPSPIYDEVSGAILGFLADVAAGLVTVEHLMLVAWRARTPMTAAR